MAVRVPAPVNPLIRSTVHGLLVSSAWIASPAATAADDGTVPNVQIPQATTKASGDAVLLEEIVVTAQKREEDLQKVTLSVDVIPGAKLIQYDLNSLPQAAATVPSVHVSASGAGGQINIRGVQSGSLSTFDQSVSVFVDDVYHGRGHSVGATFLDTSNVQVLKGPQSTFFGNNAVAGAFEIITNKPVFDEYDFEGRTLYGQFNSYAQEIAINLPAGETFAARLAAIADGTNGWQQNPYAGETQPHERNQAGRLSLRWRPNEDLDAVLKIESGNNVSHDGFAIGDCPPPSPFVPARFCGAALAMGLPTGLDSRTNTTIRGQRTDLSTQDDVLTINYLIGGQRITSVSAFSSFEYNQRAAAAGLPINALNILFNEKYQQGSEELRITSVSEDRFGYTAGIYAQVDRDSGRPNDISYFFISPVIQQIPQLAPLLPYLPLGNTGEFHQEEHSYAAFGSFSWHATSALTVTAGIRATKDIKADAGPSIYGTATADFGGIVPLPDALQPLAAAVLGTPQEQAGAHGYTGVTPSVVIKYEFSDDVMGYARYDKGFLAGIPLVVTTPGVPSVPVQAEHVDSFELGMKSQWLGGRLRTNVDVFRSDFKNQQVTSGLVDGQGNIFTEITNAGRTLTQGVEALADVAINQHFRVSVTGTYLDSHYVNYPNVADTALQSYCHQNAGIPGCVTAFGGQGDPGGLQDLSGKPTSFAPRWSGNVALTYAHDIGTWHFVFRNDAYASTNFFDGNNGLNDPLLIQPGYIRWDTLLSFADERNVWTFDLIGRNLTSKRITTGGTGATAQPASLGSVIEQDQEPRNVSAQVRYHF